VTVEGGVKEQQLAADNPFDWQKGRCLRERRSGETKAMSSPRNRQENWTAASPPFGGSAAVVNGRGMAPAEGHDEWDLLRATPDYDMVEMQGVSLPAAFHPPPAWEAPPVAAPEASWAPPVVSAPPVGAWEAPVVDAWEPPAERWPEAAKVANLASDLFVEAQGDGLWRPMAQENAVFSVASGEDWSAILTDSEDLSADMDPIHSSGSWAFLPDAMLQGGAGGVDLLNEALQAGARAGLLDAGSRLEGAEGAGAPPGPPPGGSAPGRAPLPAKDRELPDLLDAALTAGERAGLMDR
jgi:hypothetical protein